MTLGKKSKNIFTREHVYFNVSQLLEKLYITRYVQQIIYNLYCHLGKSK